MGAAEDNQHMAPLRLVLAGAPIDNPNKGLEALGLSVIDALDHYCALRFESGVVTVLTNRRGKPVSYATERENAHIEEVGAHFTRRWYRADSWARVRLAQLTGHGRNRLAQRIDDADAVLDLSGGDSFTEIYGRKRLAMVCAPKLAALRARTPLVFLPQTYGPFLTREGRQQAEAVVRGAALAWARDAQSLDRLLELAGPAADTTRCCGGVDVAFALQPRQPGIDAADLDRLTDQLVGAVGINVSGLLRSTEARLRFGLAGDYLDTITQLVRSLLAADVRVVFVPHVQSPDSTSGERDTAAIDEIVSRLSPPEAARTTCLPATFGAAELKWCISHLEWMLGSRMHSTIASLSTLVPTFGYAYSDKTAGVFETCGVASEVADARAIAGSEAVDLMLAAYRRRAGVGATLRHSVPPVIEAARSQLLTVFERVEAWRAGEPSGTIS